MMTSTAFHQWCDQLALPPATRDLLADIRGSQPVRRVTSRANNMSGTYPSDKMGVTIQYESHTVELWAILVMERDPDVLEFYDQPHTFKLQYLGKPGKKMVGHYYTPDFLVLRRSSAAFEEWKTEADLRRLAQHSPFRYQQTEDGHWRCPPAEASAQALGLSFRLRSSAELNPTYVDNLSFLADYYGVPLSVPHQAQTSILQRIREMPGLPLSALAYDGSGVRPNDVYAMLAHEQLYTDLYASPLIQHGRVRLYLNADQARAYAHLQPSHLVSHVGSPLPEVAPPLVTNATLLWDGRCWTLVNPGETTTTLLPEKGPPIQIPSSFFFHLLDTGVITPLRPDTHPPSASLEVDRLMDRASPSDLCQANERFAMVIAYLQGEKDRYAGIAPRTLHRWVARFREAETQFGCGYVGLLTRKAQQGNHAPKAPQASRDLMDTFITEQFETPRHVPAAAVYRAYLGKSRDVTLARLQTAAAVLARQGSGQDAHSVDQAGGERSYHTPSADHAHNSIPQETPFARDQTVDLGRTAHRGDSPAPHASALPTSLTPLLGREQEAQRVCSLLQRSEIRLLTLTGPGGVGKTRLGIHIASDLMHDFANGVCFVSLGPISDPELVIPTIVQALGLPEVGDAGAGTAPQPLQRLNTYLQEKQVLLLLDNFEQVVAAAPALVELLTACAQVKVLVTSRAVLRVSGEYECPVSPLALPSPKELPDARAVAQSPAVALFVQRAMPRLPDFSLTDANAAVIAAICARLDGLPLAIELAAARIKLLPPEALLARLEHRLAVLTSGARGLPARQQTLRSTIKWSYELLSADEQHLFRRLSVFVGGCTLKAVEAVCNEVDHVGLHVLDGVAALLDNSLLQQTEQAGEEPHFVMLETIREYGLECLAARGEREQTRCAHTSYYLELAEEAEPKLSSAEREQWAHRLEREHDNFRAALSWSLEQRRGDPGGRPERVGGEEALRLGGALWRFWLLHGHLSEGRQWLEKALAVAVPQVPSALRAKALGGAGVLAHYQGDYRQAKVLCEESLALFRELGDKQGMVDSLNGLGLIVGQATRARNDYAVARALYEESLAILRELGDLWGIAETHWDFARVAFYQGDYTAGNPLCEESLAIFRELGDRRRIAEILGSLGGYMAFYQGNYIIELTSMEESLAIMRELGDRRSSARLLWALGHAAFVQDDYAKARTFYEEALAILQELGVKWFIASCLDGLAEVAVAQGQPEWAAHLLGAAALLREALGVSPPPYNLANYERAVATTRAQLGEERFAAAWAEGREMTLEQVLAEQGRATTPKVPTIKEPTDTVALPPTYPDELTPREVEILRLVASGLSNAQVAEKLIISPRTVHAHVRSIYSKLGITSRSSATRYAIDHKLI